MTKEELSQISSLSASVTEDTTATTTNLVPLQYDGDQNLRNDPQPTQNHQQEHIFQNDQRSRCASWSNHVSTKEGDIVYETSVGERDESTQNGDSRLKTPRSQVLNRHIRSLSGHFQDATKLSPDNSITYSPEPDDPPYLAQHHQKEVTAYPLQEQVDPYDVQKAATLGKHRRGPSLGNTNPVMAHRRMDSGGHAAFVQREGNNGGGYSPQEQYSHHSYPGIPSPTASHHSISTLPSPPRNYWEQTYPVAKSSPSHYPRDMYGRPQSHWSKRSEPSRSTSPNYRYPPQPPMLVRGHYRNSSPPMPHGPIRDSSPHHRDASPYYGAQRIHYRDSSSTRSQGQYTDPMSHASNGYYSDSSQYRHHAPPSGGYYRQPSPPNAYLHPPNVPSPQLYAAPQYEPFTYSPDPYHPQHPSRESHNDHESEHPAQYGRTNTTGRTFPSYPPTHPLADHKSQAQQHPPEYRRQPSYSSIGSHESRLEIEENLNLSSKEFSPLQMTASINSNSHSRISPQMFMSTLNDPTLARSSPPEKVPLQHSLDSVDRHRKQSSSTNAQMKKFIHDVNSSNRTNRADSTGSFIQKHDRADSGETFTIGDGLFGEGLLEAPNTPHSLGSISHTSHRESRSEGPSQVHDANRIYASSNAGVYLADLGSAPAYYQPPTSSVHPISSNMEPTMNHGYNSNVSLYSQVSSTSEANTDVISNPNKSGNKRTRRKCVIEGCTNRVVQGGRCIAHGAQRKKCGHPGCDKNVKKAGMCSTHGPPRKLCDSEGCQKVAVQGGKCISHGAKKKVCNVEDCKKQPILNGMCKKHHDLFESGICLPVKAKNGSEMTKSSAEARQAGHTRGLSAFGDINTVNSIIEGGLGYSQVNNTTTDLGVWKS